MAENIVERVGQILIAGLPGRYDDAVQHSLCSRIMEIRVQLHRNNLVGIVLAGLRKTRRAGVGPARINVREALDYRLVVGWDRLVQPIQPGAAIVIEFNEPNRKQLHQLTREVFVRSNI